MILRRVGLVASLTAAVGVMGTGCYRSPGTVPAAGQPGALAEASPREVTVVMAELKPLSRRVPAWGSLLAQDEADLSTKVPGRLESLAVDVASQVRAGEIIARVEPRDYELRVSAAEAAVAQARARLGLELTGTNDAVALDETSVVRQAKAVLDEAEAAFSRVRSLSEQGILSASELDTAAAGRVVAQNRYRDALDDARQRQAQLAQRRVELAIARQQLADTVLRAPFDGAIQQRLASPGEYLIPGAPVARLVRMNPLRLRVEVSERDAPRIRPGQSVEVSASGDERKHVGQVTRISPALSRDTRMLAVEADVLNDGSIHPGTFAHAQIIITNSAPALLVPRKSVVTFAGLQKVWAVENGKAVEKRIVSGESGPDWIEVISGIREGETLVLDWGGLRSGQVVVARSPRGT